MRYKILESLPTILVYLFGKLFLISTFYLFQNTEISSSESPVVAPVVDEDEAGTWVLVSSEPSSTGDVETSTSSPPPVPDIVQPAAEPISPGTTTQSGHL